MEANFKIFLSFMAVVLVRSHITELQRPQKWADFVQIPPFGLCNTSIMDPDVKKQLQLFLSKRRNHSRTTQWIQSSPWTQVPSIRPGCHSARPVQASDLPARDPAPPAADPPPSPDPTTPGGSEEEYAQVPASPQSTTSNSTQYPSSGPTSENDTDTESGLESAQDLCNIFNRSESACSSDYKGDDDDSDDDTGSQASNLNAGSPAVPLESTSSTSNSSQEPDPDLSFSSLEGFNPSQNQTKPWPPQALQRLPPSYRPVAMVRPLQYLSLQGPASPDFQPRRWSESQEEYY